MIPSNRRKSPGLCCLGFAWFSAFAAYMVGTTCAASTSAPLERATFAGGCFWCEEATFEGIPGVISVISGFSGGREKDPTYDWVSSGRTGHAESVDIVFDPRRITYAKLLDIYWHNIDPTEANGQFCDHGDQYRSAIFYRGESQRRKAEQSKLAIEKSGRLKGRIVTKIVPFTRFYPAEEYHQDYSKKNPIQYNAYRMGCGRDKRLREIWGNEAPTHH
jgi:peptide-methionine (S)-S-oxide reductase